MKDGIKYVHTSDGPFQQWDGSDAAAKAETLRLKPLDYQSYALFHDGSCYNEICEFTFDDEKRGHGYYYQMNADAREQEQQKAEIGGDAMIDSFEKVWDKIDGESKSYKEILEALREEIGQRERLGSELHRKQDFKALTKVEQERETFIQVQYGIQDVSYLGEPERLKEIGLEESDIWKAARSKGLEVREKEKTLAEEEKAYEESGKLLKDCAEKLGKALDTHFKDNLLDTDAVLKNMKEHKPETISIVLANTVLAKVLRLEGDDEKFSPESKDWAQGVKLANFLQNDESRLREGGNGVLESSDPAKVEAFVKAFREMDISQSHETTGSQKHHLEGVPKGPNMAEVQAAEMKASTIQGLNKSADGISRVEGQDIGYAEEEYVIAAGQVKYEAQRARTADSEVKGRSDENFRVLKNPQIGQRVTFHPHESDKARLTGNVVATDERTVTLKCGSKKIPAIRDKGDFFEAPALKREQTKEFAQDRAQKLMGENSNIFFAQDKGTYKGEIIGLTPTYAIQKINGETAILHRLKDLQSQDKNVHDLIHEGREVSITKDENGVSLTPWSKEREEKEKIREREKSRGSQSR